MRWVLTIAALGFAAGVASADSYDPATAGTVHVVKQERGIFNLVRVKKDLRAVCGGQDPISVDVRHTTGDALAAVFTGILYTPAHLHVTCPPSTTGAMPSTPGATECPPSMPDCPRQ
jgi:hypothetical protein